MENPNEEIRKVVDHLKYCIDRLERLKIKEPKIKTKPISKPLFNGEIMTYLKELESKNDEVSLLAKDIKEILLRTPGKDERERYENACVEYYGNINDKLNKKLVAKIARMEKI